MELQTHSQNPPPSTTTTTTTTSLSSPPPPPPSNEPETDEPALKKTKMSSTTTSDDDAGVKPRRYKRRKVAIFMAYCGVGYQGMQKNPGAKTIEGDLEEALFFAGAVPADERGQHKRYDWARSARTDKGVSAVGQVISGRFFVDPPGFVNRLNSFLSPQIRVFGFCRATPSFSAKKFCDRRRYVYLLPVFALDPTCHRDRESVLASLGSGDELVKCVGCSERGRKVFGVVGNSRVLKSDVVSVEDVDKPEDGDLTVENVNGALKSESEDGNLMVENPNDVLKSEPSVENTNDVLMSEPEDRNLGAENANTVGEVSKNDEDVLKSELSVLKSELSVENTNDVSMKEPEDGNLGAENANAVGEVSKNDEDVVSLSKELGSKSEFVYGDEVKERLNRILKYYEGTHNFHNFTTRTKAEDPSAKRYIVSFQANSTLTIDGIEFVKCVVVGQSFMLHQIRKMIGMAVAVMRNFASESIYETAFDRDVKINVPTAPEVGLYLDECLFTSYNNKWHGTHEEISMKSYEEEAEEFKMKNIHPHIARTEHEEGTVALFLHSLNRRNYPDICQAQEVVEGAETVIAGAETQEVVDGAETQVVVEGAQIQEAVERAESQEVVAGAADT